MDNILINLLQVAKEITDVLIPVGADHLYGVDTEIFFPVSNNSIYGRHDNRLIYNNNPDLEGKFTVIGIFSERYNADSSADMYEETYLITQEAIRIPKNSKVILRLTDQQEFTFKVYSNMSTPGNNLSIYRKVILVPMEIKGSSS